MESKVWSFRVSQLLFLGNHIAGACALLAPVTDVVSHLCLKRYSLQNLSDAGVAILKVSFKVFKPVNRQIPEVTMIIWRTLEFFVEIDDLAW